MRILVFAFLLMGTISFGQKSEIVSIESNDRILRGYIAEDYPITMYLKVAYSSDNVGYIYSVSGWYKYNKIGTQIPLAGIWTGSELHLFVSDNPKFLKNILNFTYEGEKGKEYLDNHIYELESFTEKLPEIKERFHLKFEEHRIAGDWKSKDKRFWVSINSNSNSIMKEVDYIKLPNGKHFNLSNLGIPGRADINIVNSANNGKNLILEYAYQANLNYNGRCGGATTAGKMGVSFNDDFQLSSYTNMDVINCYREVSIKEEKVSDSVINYKIFDYSSNEEEVYTLDSKNATLKKIKK